MQTIKTILMVMQVLLVLVLGPLLQVLARAQSRKAPTNVPWDRDEAPETCSLARHYDAECDFKDCESKQPHQRSLFQVQASRGIMDAQTEEVTDEDVILKPDTANNSNETVEVTKDGITIPKATTSSKEKEVTKDGITIPKGTTSSKEKAPGFLQNLRPALSAKVSTVLHRVRDAALWAWNRAGRHSNKAIAFVQTTRHWAASRAASVDLAIWASFLGLILLVVCLLGCNAVSLRRPAHAAVLASTRSVSDPAVYTDAHWPSIKGVSRDARWSAGPGSLLSSKALTPHATSAQLDPRLSVMDASPTSHYIGTPGPTLQAMGAKQMGPYPPTRSPEPSSLMPPARKAPVNPKRFCPQLCPGLVVPLGSECILAVKPVSPMPSPRESAMATVEILDLCGKPVLKAMVCRIPKNCFADSRSSVKPTVTLRMLESPHGRLESSVLATCSQETDENGRRQMRIHDANNKLFGHLGRDSAALNRYMLRCKGGADPRDSKRKCTVSFEGVFASHTVVIQNEYHEQLADSEECVMTFSPSSKFYKLRVASGVDVGLMICSLVCIDELETSASKEPLSRSGGSSGDRSPWS